MLKKQVLALLKIYGWSAGSQTLIHQNQHWLMILCGLSDLKKPVKNADTRENAGIGTNRQLRRKPWPSPILVMTTFQGAKPNALHKYLKHRLTHKEFVLGIRAFGRYWWHWAKSLISLLQYIYITDKNCRLLEMAQLVSHPKSEICADQLVAID